MLLVMLTFFFQFHRAGTHSGKTSGNDSLFIRGRDQLSWLAAREACDSTSSVILPSIRDSFALGLLHVGEFAWIDGKEYTFCYEKNATETQEKCRYVTVRREDTRQNLTCLCQKDSDFEVSEEILPYAAAVQKCRSSQTSLRVVETFVLPMVVPVNRTYWIGEYNDSRIMNSLSPGQTVTEICIGIVKLDHDKFEFSTTSCDENHTFICDASGVETALTLTTKDETMPTLGDVKARIASNQMQPRRLIFIVLGPTLGVLLLVIIAIIAIVRYKKRKLNQELAYQSKYPKRPSDEKMRQDLGLLSPDNIVQQDIESENQTSPCNSLKSSTTNKVKSNNYNWTHAHSLIPL